MVSISSCFSFKRISNSDIRCFCKSSALYISSIFCFLPLPLASIAPIVFDELGVMSNLGGIGNADDNNGCTCDGACCCGACCKRCCGLLNFPNSLIIFFMTALLLFIIISDAFFS